MLAKKEKSNKIKILLRDKRILFHTQDLGVLWGIDNSNTLYTTIKRYIQRGLLNKVYKGFYSTVPLKEIDPVLLGLASLHGYGYLSCESVLARDGIVFQDVKYITLVSDISRKFRIGGHSFLVRRMKPGYLYNNVGITEDGGKRVACPERAVADMLYFNSKYHFDAKNLIDWQKVKEIKKEIGY